MTEKLQIEASDMWV